MPNKRSAIPLRKTGQTRLEPQRQPEPAAADSGRKETTDQAAQPKSEIERAYRGLLFTGMRVTLEKGLVLYYLVDRDDKNNGKIFLYETMAFPKIATVPFWKRLMCFLLANIPHPLKDTCSRCQFTLPVITAISLIEIGTRRQTWHIHCPFCRITEKYRHDDVRKI